MGARILPDRLELYLPRSGLICGLIAILIVLVAALDFTFTGFLPWHPSLHAPNPYAPLSWLITALSTFFLISTLHMLRRPILAFSADAQGVYLYSSGWRRQPTYIPWEHVEEIRIGKLFGPAWEPGTAPSTAIEVIFNGNVVLPKSGHALAHPTSRNTFGIATQLVQDPALFVAKLEELHQLGQTRDRG